MILISNVKITNKPLYQSPNRCNLSAKPDRMDIWKYSLSTFVPLLPIISKVCLYVDLASTEYAGQEPVVEEYLRSIFPADKLIIRWYRNNTTADWRKSCLEDVFPVGDNIIFNLINDDHLFIDRNTDVLLKMIAHLNASPDPYAQIIHSHWPETIRRARHSGFIPLDDLSGFVGHGRAVQSIDICKIERWKHYWFDHDFGDKTDVFRPDENLDRAGVLSQGNTQFVPIRELVRHFDGYEHAAQFANLAPPVEIPEGFFERNIKIAYGFPDIKPGYVNINPASANLKALDGVSADYKFALEDIPLGWQGRVSEILVNPEADIETLKKLRDAHFYSIAMAPIGGPHVHPVTNPFPKELFKNQFLSNESY